MIYKSHFSLPVVFVLWMWLSTLLVSALPNSYPALTSAEAEEDDYDADLKNVEELEKLRSLLTSPGLTIEYKTSINRPTDLTLRKRYGFAGLDNLDVIHRMLENGQPENMASNRESKFSIRQLMERHG